MRVTLLPQEILAISKWTHATKMENVFDIVDPKSFYDFEEDTIVSIQEGMSWIADSIAYHPSHDLPEEYANTLCDLLIEFKVMTLEELNALPK